LTKRMRAILAIITGLVTLAMAYQLSFAAEASPDVTTDPQACTAVTRSAYEDQRALQTIEQSPAYRLAIAEEFLAICNTPLHVQAVAKHAARAALDAGRPDAALSHFEQALNTGASLSEKEQLDYVLALWLNGETERAWTLRDDLIADWLIEADRFAEITSTNVRDGVIHKLVFNAPVGKVGTQTHWLAQPHGEGWPAAVSLDADPALMALAAFRMGSRAQNLQDLTLIQCRGRQTAARAYGQITPALAEDTAVETLKTYLRQPQSPIAQDAGRPAAACYATDRLFVPLR